MSKFVELNSTCRSNKIKNRFVLHFIDHWLIMAISIIVAWIIIYLNRNGVFRIAAYKTQSELLEHRPNKYIPLFTKKNLMAPAEK